MDIVLEVFDTLLFDRLYATTLPASSISYAAQKAGNATSFHTSVHSSPTAVQFLSKFLHLEPSQFAYMSSWPRDYIWRQVISLYLITWLFGLVVYFLCASASYLFIFDHATFTHPKYLKNQVALEIKQAFAALPVMAVLTVPFFIAEVRGFAKLYEAPSSAPFALHAFHPFDGFAQSIPYHVFPFVFPLQKVAYIILFAFINIWTVFIHDGEYVANSSIINGAACHTMHHLYFNYNYGQFTTLWDRLGGSYRQPNEELFSREKKMSKSEWERQCHEMEKLQREVEGDDDRDYGNEARRLQKKVL
ncbi:MAG: hypothetical protein Q9167_001746 [Letrouitia subvulpina]